MRLKILILSFCVLGVPLFADDLSKSLGLLKAKLLALAVDLSGEKKIEVKIEEIKIEEKLEEEDITKSLDYFVNEFLSERKISQEYVNKLKQNKKNKKKEQTLEAKINAVSETIAEKWKDIKFNDKENVSFDLSKKKTTKLIDKALSNDLKSSSFEAKSESFNRNIEAIIGTLKKYLPKVIKLVEDPEKLKKELEERKKSQEEEFKKAQEQRKKEEEEHQKVLEEEKKKLDQQKKKFEDDRKQEVIYLSKYIFDGNIDKIIETCSNRLNSAFEFLKLYKETTDKIKKQFKKYKETSVGGTYDYKKKAQELINFLKTVEAPLSYKDTVDEITVELISLLKINVSGVEALKQNEDKIRENVLQLIALLKEEDFYLQNSGSREAFEKFTWELAFFSGDMIDYLTKCGEIDEDHRLNMVDMSSLLREIGEIFSNNTKLIKYSKEHFETVLAEIIPALAMAMYYSVPANSSINEESIKKNMDAQDILENQEDLSKVSEENKKTIRSAIDWSFEKHGDFELITKEELSKLLRRNNLSRAQTIFSSGENYIALSLGIILGDVYPEKKDQGALDFGFYEIKILKQFSELGKHKNPDPEKIELSDDELVKIVSNIKETLKNIDNDRLFLIDRIFDEFLKILGRNLYWFLEKEESVKTILGDLNDIFVQLHGQKDLDNENLGVYADFLWKIILNGDKGIFVIDTNYSFKEFWKKVQEGGNKDLYLDELFVYLEKFLKEVDSLFKEEKIKNYKLYSVIGGCFGIFTEDQMTRITKVGARLDKVSDVYKIFTNIKLCRDLFRNWGYISVYFEINYDLMEAYLGRELMLAYYYKRSKFDETFLIKKNLITKKIERFKQVRDLKLVDLKKKLDQKLKKAENEGVDEFKIKNDIKAWSKEKEGIDKIIEKFSNLLQKNEITKKEEEYLENQSTKYRELANPEGDTYYDEKYRLVYIGEEIDAIDDILLSEKPDEYRETLLKIMKKELELEEKFEMGKIKKDAFEAFRAIKKINRYIEKREAVNDRLELFIKRKDLSNKQKKPFFLEIKNNLERNKRDVLKITTFDISKIIDYLPEKQRQLDFEKKDFENLNDLKINSLENQIKKVEKKILESEEEPVKEPFIMEKELEIEEK